MKLSVIIPVYKVEKTLGRCLDSIVGQPVADMEIILVDDGSPDGCLELCDAWAERDSRIIVIHKVNGGLSDARNAGIAIAKGDVITFVDSDDYIAPNTYPEVLAEMDKDSDIIEYPIFKFYGAPQQSLLQFERRKYVDMAEYWLRAETYRHAYVCNKIFRRELFNDIKFPIGKAFEDVYTLPKLLGMAKKVQTTSAGLYYYCWNENGLTANPTAGSLEMLLDAHLMANATITDERYYLHVLNIQLDVTDRTGAAPRLNNLKIMNTKSFGLKDKAKAMAINLMGIERVCKLHRIFYKTRNCLW